VARVLAYVPDLLFGSNVAGALRAAGHEVELVSELASVAPGVEVVIVDLTVDPEPRIRRVASIGLGGAKVLAFYSHVEAEVRAAAEQAGLHQVVPRSRMARESATLVARLAAS
jgi:hypothetical protein